MKPPLRDHPGLRIAASYAVVSVLWIMLANAALEWLGYSNLEIIRLQTTKDFAFVIISTAVLAVLLHLEYGERIAAEEQTRRTSERLASAVQQAGARAQEWKALIEAVPAAILVAHDVHCSRVTGNSEAMRLFGSDSPDLRSTGNLSVIKTDAIRLVHEGRDLRTDSFPLNAAAGSGREVREFECILVREGAPDRLLVATAVPMLTPRKEPRGAVAAFIDITDRSANEIRLREQASLIDQAREAMIVHDLDGRITYWNPSAERLYGWKQSHALGLLAKDILYPGMVAPKQAQDSLFDRGAWLGELLQKSRDGKTFTVEAHWTLLRDPDDRPSRVFCIHTDITDRKALEEQFLRAQRLESIGRLASGIAHDLNNVLAPVMMAMGAFREKLTDQDSLELLDAAESSINRGSNLLRQILLLSRGERGRRIPLNLKPMFTELQKFTFETFPKTISTDIECEESLWPIPSDPSQIHQILLNLCVNARDAMPEGGTLRLRASNKDFKVKAAKKLGLLPGPHVVVEVEDTGAGIPPEILGKVFDPFFTTKEEGKGTGLGLTTVASLVRGHHGSVDIASTQGKGTCFTIRFPALPSASATTEGEESKELVPGRGEWVLVVDDELAILKVTRTTLLKAGYHVLEAESGAAAMEILASGTHKVALLLSDIVMPGIDGWTLMRQARRVDPNLKILGMTGFNDHVSERANDLGCDVLHKPFSVPRLLASVRTSLDSPQPTAVG